MSVCVGSAWKILGASPDVTSSNVTDSRTKRNQGQSFFSGVSCIWGSYIWGSSKNFPGTTHTDRHFLESVTSGEVTSKEVSRIFQALPRQTDK
jgi:hypothetical protein